MGGTKDRTAQVVSIFPTMVLFYANWLMEVVPALWPGDVPRSVLRLGVPAYAIPVLDMSILLPAIDISACGLWRGKPWGIRFAGLLLFLTLALGGEILTLSTIEWLPGFPVSTGWLIPYSILLIIDSILSIAYWKRIPEETRHP